MKKAQKWSGISRKSGTGSTGIRGNKECQLRSKLNAHRVDGGVTSDHGNTETAGNPERVPASNLGRYPAEQVPEGLLRWAEN